MEFCLGNVSTCSSFFFLQSLPRGLSIQELAILKIRPYFKLIEMRENEILLTRVFLQADILLYISGMFVPPLSWNAVKIPVEDYSLNNCCAVAHVSILIDVSCNFQARSISTKEEYLPVTLCLLYIQNIYIYFLL